MRPVPHQPVRHHHPVPEPPGQPARWNIEGPYATIPDIDRLDLTARRAAARSANGGEKHISINTVKTHLAHINRKLATTRRAEAVRRGRELELI